MGQYEKLLLALMSGAKDRKVPSPVHAPGLYRRDPVQYAARRPTRRPDQPAGIQPVGSKAKPYQCKQVRQIILKYDLGGALNEV